MVRKSFQIAEAVVQQNNGILRLYQAKRLGIDEKTPALLKISDSWSIRYQRHEQVAVYSSEQRARRLISPLPSASAKQVSRGDETGNRHLVVRIEPRPQT